ncbi:MAG TPA: hypothetical protein VNW97_07750 [Candidatus Saccharimonadales bacterium]|jgi:hypothetical protein|nr:hypothetical protein [Candidatus Saccharimonadales bacterium]
MARFPKSLRGREATLKKRAKHGLRGYPIATVAFYGPTNLLATKMVVSIFLKEEGGPDFMEDRSTDGVDIRNDERIAEEMTALIQGHNVKSVSMADRIIGCPHEEGIDYPEGQSCSQCPFWAGRDRFTHERIQ